MQEINTTSRVKKLTGKFIHSVIGWSGVQRNVGDHIESPQVELCGHKWKMRIFPGGSSFKHSSFVSMYLANRSPTSVSASYQLFIRNQLTNEDELIFSSVGVKQFEVQGQGKIDGWGRDRFLSHDRILSETGILINDTITFGVEITVYGELENYYTSLKTGSTLDQDLRNLLMNNSLSSTDVTLIVGDQEYHLHRCILIARSPVFRAILENPTKEKETGIILLKEDDPIVVDHFIKFLYSDYCSERILQTMCQQLYVLATKYQVPLLITACEQTIITNALNSTTAVSILQFADFYGTHSLQNRVMKYFHENCELIMKSEEYLSLSNEEREEIHKKIAIGLNLNERYHKIDKSLGIIVGSRFTVCSIM